MARLSLQAARVAAWDWDLVSGEVVRSDNAEASYGLPTRSRGGWNDTFFRMIYPEDRARVSEALKQARAG